MADLDFSSLSDIYMEMRLAVIGDDTIIVPGCEPESTISSPVLSMWRRCTSATVKLSDALEAIPGSRVELQENNSKWNGSRRKWFVLPPYYFGCPCSDRPDYYGILRDLSQDEDTEVDLSYCGIIDQGFCPPKNLSQQEPPPVYPYQEEGTFPTGITAVLNYPGVHEPDTDDASIFIL